MKFRIFLAFYILTYGFTFGQTKVKYTMSAEAHALMCPFLSPQLMNLLTKNGAEGIYKDETLQLHFTTSKEKELTDDTLLKYVDLIGYDPKMFKISRIEE